MPMDSETEARLRHLCATNGVALPKTIASIADLTAVPKPVLMHAVRPHQLQALGAASAEDMARLGIGAEELVLKHDWCIDASLIYGRTQLLRAVLRSASDAVWLAGTDAGQTLGVDASMLLRACEGRPVEGAAVLITLREAWLRGKTAYRLIPLAHFLTNTRVADVAQLRLTAQQLLEVVPESELRDAYGGEADVLFGSSRT
jgi:hypothetical protein